MPDFTAFYQRLRQLDHLPTTSQPSIGDFLEVYEPLAADGPRHRLGPHRRRDLGHVGERAPGRAEIATKYPGRRVEVIDSRPPAAASACARWPARPPRAPAADVDAVAARVNEAPTP